MAESSVAVRQAFDAWRLKSPVKGRPYPKSLRERALALRWAGNDGELSAALGLSHGKVLRNWRAQAKQPADEADRELLTPAAFVEVGTVGGLKGALATDGENRVLELALSSGDGPTTGCDFIKSTPKMRSTG